VADKENVREKPSETVIVHEQQVEPMQKSGLATALIVLAFIIVILLIIMRYNPFGGSGGSG
jgi:hypothetical protein